jgi:hypothetical protein
MSQNSQQQRITICAHVDLLRGTAVTSCCSSWKSKHLHEWQPLQISSVISFASALIFTLDTYRRNLIACVAIMLVTTARRLLVTTWHMLDASGLAQRMQSCASGQAFLHLKPLRPSCRTAGPGIAGCWHAGHNPSVCTASRHAVESTCDDDGDEYAWHTDPARSRVRRATATLQSLCMLICPAPPADTLRSFNTIAQEVLASGNNLAAPGGAAAATAAAEAAAGTQMVNT